MPNWKKVIVSGSNASLNSLIVDNGITGSLFGTASYVLNAVSASFATSASFAQNAVSSSYPIEVSGSSLLSVIPRAGLSGSTSNGIFLGANAGLSASLASNSNFLGQNAGNSASLASNSNFFGTSAGVGARNASNSNFFGQSTGNSAASANNSNFLGQSAGLLATSASNSNFLGQSAGSSATEASQSNFIGFQAGRSATNAAHSNFFGRNAGFNATSASFSTLIGYQAGYNTAGGALGIRSNNIIIGTNITLEHGRQDSINLGGLIFGTGSYSTIAGNPFSGSANGRVGINVVNPLYTLDVSGSGNYTNGLTVSGSTTITGSLGVGTTGSAVVGRIDASNDVVAFATSDINLKENLKPIANALYKLDNIQGYTFDWKQDEKLVSQHGFTGRDIGVIAQEIEEILPEVVTTRDSGYKAVKYEKIVPFLIQCIKELKDEIEELKGAKTPKKTRKPRAKNKPE